MKTMDYKTQKELGVKGIKLIIISVVFGVSETIYFGNNWMPKTVMELLCDYIASGFCGAGTALLFVSFKNFINNGKRN